MKKILMFLMAVVSVGLGSTPSVKAQTVATPINASQFVGGQMPQVGNNVLRSTGYVVCYNSFCSMSSSATKGAIWSAEHLTNTAIVAARGASRKSLQFFPDPHIPAAASATTSDYTRTGYDRGHMAPWADSADPNCFTLSNIVPQNPDNNRNLWEGIEASTRDIALRYGEIYVVSGPIYAGSDVKMLKGRVAIPTAFFKAVYIPSIRQAGAYITKNGPGYWWQPTTIQSVIKLTHTDPFPALPASIKNVPGELMNPNVHGRFIPPGQQ